MKVAGPRGAVFAAALVLAAACSGESSSSDHSDRMISLDASKVVKTLRLPSNAAVKVLAATLSRDG